MMTRKPGKTGGILATECQCDHIVADLREVVNGVRARYCIIFEGWAGFVEREILVQYMFDKNNTEGRISLWNRV